MCAPEKKQQKKTCRAKIRLESGNAQRRYSNVNYISDESLIQQSGQQVRTALTLTANGGKNPSKIDPLATRATNYSYEFLVSLLQTTSNKRGRLSRFVQKKVSCKNMT